MVTIKLYIHNSDDNEMSLCVLHEHGATVEHFPSGSTVELPIGTELLAHEEDINNMKQVSCCLTTILYQLPCGIRFGHLQKTVGEFGTYKTTDKLDIHLNTL